MGNLRYMKKIPINFSHIFMTDIADLNFECRF